MPPNQKPRPHGTPDRLPRYVAYYRVSTVRQGASGLGAQRTSVENFTRGRGQIVGEYKDVESGKRNDRPELNRAIAMCKAEGAVLLIARLDRLTRHVAFVCADMPEANTLTIGVMATMAQHDRTGDPPGWRSRGRRSPTAPRRPWPRRSGWALCWASRKI